MPQSRSTDAAFSARSRKSIFDTVRTILGRGFRQSEVEAIDAAFDTGLETRVDGPDSYLPPDSVQSVQSTENKPRISVPKVLKRGVNRHAIGADGIALIKHFEGCARLRRDGLVEAYPDPGTGGAPWTIGWGATRDGLHGFVEPNTVWTQEQCNQRLVDDLELYCADVTRAIGTAPTTQGQFDAMVSFHYNTGAIDRATLTKRHKAGDHAGAAAEFKRWNKASGRVLKGLVRRRAAEAKLYAS